MPFLEPNLPEVDHTTWHDQPRLERMRPFARHYAEFGFGSPDVMIVMYAVKIALYLGVGWLFVVSAPGDATFLSAQTFFTFVFWTMLFEVLGLGCGFGPLNLRFIPPMGAFLYWLRPGTIRLAPWPARVPLTGGDSHTPVDVALYAALLVALTVAAWGAPTRTESVVVLALLLVLGLRDKVIFLAARSEVYAPLAAALLLSGLDPIIAAKVLLCVIWWGAATSKINLHFPFVVAAMMSNSPIWRFGSFKRRFHDDFPDDLRPSRVSATLVHVGTVVEFGVPVLLLVSDGGRLTAVAAAVMVAFHLNIISSFPMGVPLEWNVFMIIGILTLFVENAALGVTDLTDPLLAAGLVAIVLAGVVVGNLWPEKVSFLPSMRYYAGNWAASVWCFRGDALERFDAGVLKASQMPHQQLEKVYGSMDEAMVPLHLGYTFRGFHTHGRALWSLVPRACGPEHEEYLALDGELVAGTALGWNFGDGHLHHEQLGRALQARCDFAPGDVRVVFLESQPFLPMRGARQTYRLFDPAVGEIERGYVEVADLVDRQPVRRRALPHHGFLKTTSYVRL